MIKVRKLKRPPKRLLRARKAYTAFLDILGFQALLDGSDSREKIEAIVGAIQKRVEFDGPRYLTIKYLAISDTIIVVADKGAGLLLARKIVQIQNALLKIGFAVRGGVTFGDVLTYSGDTGENIFGKSYVKSYLLERDMAIYPRVLVDSSAAKPLKNDIREKSIRLTSTFICRDRDGLDFINQFSNDQISASSKLKKNRDAAVANRKKYARAIISGTQDDDPKVAMKWRWLERQLHDQLPLPNEP